MLRFPTCCLLSFGVILSSMVVPGSIYADPSEAELLAGAETRIEQHRKADGVVTVVDAAGKPLADVEVEVEQTRHQFLFGSNIFIWGKLEDEQSEQAYRHHFSELLNYATIGFYWPSYEPQRGKPNHEYAAQVAKWCQKNGIRTKGHPLAWNPADAAWYPDDPAELFRLQLARIDDCVRRFAGLIDRWDVVNEVAEFDRDWTRTDSPKHTAMWRHVGQMEFTRECFVRARQANPQSTLLINDYIVGPAYERVIEQLVDSEGKRLYDVIGIQSHMHGGVWSTEKIWDVCQRFARFGVPLHFTEMTIVSGKVMWQKEGDWPTTPEGEAYQAREVVRFYTMLFSHPAVEAITWWDLSDRHSFLQGPGGLLRADMTPKPAYEELKRLVKGKWWTVARLRTGPDGTVAFRGFLGDYRITVRAGDKPPVVLEASLARGRENHFQVAVR